jgi:hypothetical protein
MINVSGNREKFTSCECWDGFGDDSNTTKSKVDVSEIDFYLRVAESSPKNSRWSLLVLKWELCLHGRNDFTNKALCGSRVKK